MKFSIFYLAFVFLICIYVMNFSEWLKIDEAKVDPKLFRVRGVRGYDGKRGYLMRNMALMVDSSGNVVRWDGKKRSYMEINPNAGQIDLYFMSPQSKEFRSMIKALRPYYSDLGRFKVSHVFMAMHMVTGRPGKYTRTVGYWMSRPESKLANKLPKYFYHGTSTNLWYDGIKGKGLVPRDIIGSSGSYGAMSATSLSREGLVYLSADPDFATREASSQAARRHGGLPLIIRVSTEGLDAAKFMPDEDTQVRTAQESLDIASTLAYKGRIPASNLEPFLMLRKKGEKWVPFEDVEVSEHPLTKVIRSKEMPHYGSYEHHVLYDAGIIGKLKTPDAWGSRESIEYLHTDVTDKEVRDLLKKNKWAVNVEPIRVAFVEAYHKSTPMSELRNYLFNPEILKEDSIKKLLKNDLLNVGNYNDGVNFGFNQSDFYPKSIGLAKDIESMGYGKFAKNLYDIIEKYKIS